MELYSNIGENKVETKNNKPVIWFVSIVLLFIYLVISAYEWNSERIIKNINISGNTFIASDEIKKNIGIQNTKKESVNLESIRQNVASHPYVEKSSIMTDRPDEIKIEIKEKYPIAFLMDDLGNEIPVDANGNLLPDRNKEIFDEIPFIQNVMHNGNINYDALYEALKIASILKTDYANSLNRNIAGIIFIPDKNEFSLITRNEKFNILIGKSANIKNISDKINKFLDIKLKEIKNIAIKKIDARWNRQIVVETIN